MDVNLYFTLARIEEKVDVLLGVRDPRCLEKYGIKVESPEVPKKKKKSREEIEIVTPPDDELSQDDDSSDGDDQG